MNADRWALALACVLLLAGLPASALAQSLDEQVGRAGARAEQLAQDTREDPQAAVGNATNASWQGQQVNWTTTWSCQTAHAVDERAGEAAEQVSDCSPASARAGEEQAANEEEDEAQADAEQAEADAERAARDGIATVQAFLQDTTEDPEEAPGHAATLVNRTLSILESLVGGLTSLATLPLAGGLLAVDGLAWATQAALDATRSTAGGLAQAASAAGEGLATSAGMLAHGLEAGSQGLADGVQASLDAVAEAAHVGLDRARASLDSVRDLLAGPPDTAEAPQDPSGDALEPLAEEDAAVRVPLLS